MADYAISNVPRRVVYAASGVGPYAFTFEILAAGDIAVYKGDTLLTLTTDYTVTIASNGTGSVTLVATAGTSNITIVGSKTIARTTDFTTGGDFFANTLNDELDAQTIFIQQVAETAERGMKAPVTDPTDINMTLPRKADRAGKYLAFDSNGNPEPGPTSSDVSTVAAIASDIQAVSDIASDVTTVADNDTNVTTVATNIGSVNSVATNIANVNATATNITNVNAVGADLLEAVSEINTVATSIANVDAVGGNISNVNSVAGNATNINAVAGNATNINTVSGISSNVSTVAGISANVTTVAGISANVTSVAGNSSNINAVAANATNINAVAGNATNINAVNSNKTNIDTVAGISSNVTTVATNNANVTTVATNIASVNTCATDIAQIITTANDLNEAVSEIEVVANNITNVNTVGTNIANVNTVAGISADVTTVATNVADVTNYADTYLGAKTSDPATRNDSSALQAGDLYFNTTDDVMKVYEGGSWVAAYASLSGALIASNNLSDLTSESTARTNLGLGSGDSPTFAGLTDSGNLTFTGTGNRITGDFSNGTLANRVIFQTSTTNGNTSIATLPNGTATVSQIQIYGGSDIANTTRGALYVNGSTEVRLGSDTTGTGTYAPITMHTGGSERLRIDTSGFVGIGTSSPSYKLTVDGGSQSQLFIQRSTGTTLTPPSSYATTIDGFLVSVVADNSPFTRFSDLVAGVGGAASVMRFFTGTAGTSCAERMRIDTSGNVGIGTSSPGFKLDVNGTAGFAGATAFNGGANTLKNTGELQWKDSGGTAQNVLFMFSDNNVYLSSPVAGSSTIFRGVGYAERMRIDSSGGIRIGSSANPSASSALVSLVGAPSGGASCTQQFTYNGGTFGGSLIGSGSQGGGMEFYTFTGNVGSESYTERMRIDTSGNLLVAGTSFNANGSVCIGAIDPGANGCTAVSASTSATNIWRFYNPNGNVGAISISGSATTYATSSDYRLKENIAPMTGALDVVQALKPVTYNWKADGSSGQGFIAHELQAVVPECVTGEKDAVDAEGKPVYQGIDTSFLVATLTKAIQEQQALIENLTTRLNALEGK